LIGGLVVLLGIIAMITVHEAGHFLAAKAVGIKATKFYFGFGPKLWSTQRGETEYGIRAFPIGGYVNIVGMDPSKPVSPEDVGRTYHDKPFWVKSVVVLAGVASHFVIAFLLFFVVVSLVGVSVSTTTIEEVQATLADGTVTPAAAAGLQDGDRIVGIDDLESDEWPELVAYIAGHPGETVEIAVDRGGETLTLEATLAALDDGTRGYLGVRSAQATDRAGPIQGVVDSGAAVGEATVASVTGLWRMVSGFGGLVEAAITGDAEKIEDTRPASPIGLVRIGAETQSLGFAFTLELIALVNVFVGVFNLVPMPPFDGGHFAVALYEKVRGRRVDVSVLAPVTVVVVVFMLLLGVLAIYLDIANPFTLQ
jgi:membrane-associated protease RseP (regulator of RpoE activity)